MILPIGDDQVQGGHRPIFAYSLIAINSLVFLYEFSLSHELVEKFILGYGAIPDEILNGQDYYTLITSMFLHGGWFHIIGNMLFLWVFADNIEAVIGSFNFIIFYLFGGIIASVIHIFFNPYSEIPMVGASGAISAVLGAYLIMFPASRIKVLLIIFFAVFYVPAIFFLGIWIVQNIIAGIGVLNDQAPESSGVAWWAHIGGFAFGVIIGFIIRSFYKNRYRYVSQEEHNV
ncbi:MAG: rhomboid family intramembrane serine protease [Saprospiraceae bacterium]|nr:rhomboid family intramembrane serine protease [Saprospiraceae bacterium]